MTTIAIRDGIIAADSRTTIDSEAGGSRVFRCEKLYRAFEGTAKEAILATAGESFSALLFVDWYRSENRPVEIPERLVNGEADFTVVALTREGLFEYDKWCRGEKILDKFYAIGSGAKAALGAMHMGASAEQAVRIACKIDPYSALPLVVWTLSNPSKRVSPKPSLDSAPRIPRKRSTRPALTQPDEPKGPGVSG
jgi:hypothetical protein